MKIVWQQVRGVGAVLMFPFWMARRLAPFDFRSFLLSRRTTRNGAVLICLLALSAGYLIALDIPRQVEIDQCLDHGGAYNYQTGDCLFAENR